jgi:hypothetical protein
MQQERQRHVLDYGRPPRESQKPVGPADGWLVVVFFSYASVNYLLVDVAFGSYSPWDVLLAFATFLPFLFIVVTLGAHFGSSPPLFNGWVLLAVILLVLGAGVVNWFIFGEAVAAV